jgi:hypothetical protein
MKQNKIFNSTSIKTLIEQANQCSNKIKLKNIVKK